MPWESWYFGRGAKPGQPSPFKWTYHFGFGGAEFHKCYVSQWSLIPTNKKVGVLYPNDSDGTAVRDHLAPALAKSGFIIVDPGPYEDGTTDYSAQIAKFKAEKCEIFNSFPIPPDFTAFWRQAAQQGYTRMVKIAQIAKACLFPYEVTALGNLGYNLASAAYWHKAFPYKSSLTGVGGEELAAGMRKTRAGSGRSSSARRCRVRRRFRRLAGERRSDRQGRGRQGDVDAQDRHHRRPGRLHLRPGAQRLARADHRHPMGEGAGRIEVQARVPCDRARHRPECSHLGKTQAIQRLTAAGGCRARGTAAFCSKGRG